MGEMRQGKLVCERALLLALLAASVVAPVLFFAAKFPSPAEGEASFVGDLSAPTRRFRPEALRVEATGREPVREISEHDGTAVPRPRSSDDADVLLPRNAASVGKTLDENNQVPDKANEDPHKAVSTDDLTKEMKDHLIMAKAYLHFAHSISNLHLVRELKLRIKETERIIGHTNRDSDLSTSALQRKKAMEVSLSKAGKVFANCSAVATQLRSMTHNTGEKLRAHKNRASYLLQLAARTFPKGLHCVSMSLTAEYFALHNAERELPNNLKTAESNLHHYVILSDNVLACAVVINSTVSSSMHQDKTVFHVVTDSTNYPAMAMWFLMNPPGNATISIDNVDSFKWYNSSYSSMAAQTSIESRSGFGLNHLRFYLPQIFPYLDKVLLLDHDVVVQKDLSRLWEVKMNGKVNGAVEMRRTHVSDFRLERLADFSDPFLSANFERLSCAWAFGVNIFDLREWRRQGLTSVYQKLLQLSKSKQIFKAGSLTLGQLTFYNSTEILDHDWHVHGLGTDPSIERSEIERAAVIHYDGIMKPWLEIGLAKYKEYWTRFLNYGLPCLQQCNIHP